MMLKRIIIIIILATGLTLTATVQAQAVSRDSALLINPIEQFYRDTNNLTIEEKAEIKRQLTEKKVASYRCSAKIWRQAKTRKQARKIGPRAAALWLDAWKGSVMYQQASWWVIGYRSSFTKTEQQLSQLKLQTPQLQQGALALAQMSRLTIERMADQPMPDDLGCATMKILRDRKSWSWDDAAAARIKALKISQVQLNKWSQEQQTIKATIEQTLITLKKQGATRYQLSKVEEFPFYAWWVYYSA